MTEAVKYDIKKWIIELTDLSENNAFMGNALSSKYLMIGITSPTLESQISINSISEDQTKKIHVPLCLEKCNSMLSGQLTFKGLEKLTNKWEIFFLDNRFDQTTPLFDLTSLQITELKSNRRSEQLRLIGYTNSKADCSNLFELVLKPKLKE